MSKYQILHKIKTPAVEGCIIEVPTNNLDPKTAYLCCDDRWLLELVFNRYKNDECLDWTNAQGDFSVLGDEFVNYISTVATYRIIRKARQCGLLEKISYGRPLSLRGRADPVLPQDIVIPDERTANRFYNPHRQPGL